VLTGKTPLLSERAALEAQLESRATAIDDLALLLEERTAAVQELKRKLAETASLEASHDNELTAALAQNTSVVTERDSLLRNSRIRKPPLFPSEGIGFTACAEARRFVACL